jgi:superfamily II DNA/RNA helicase
MEILIETTKNFSQFGLNDKLITALNSMGFTEASEIQAMTIEPILEGKDIFAQAETGSGKTGSFAIPVVERLLSTEKLEQKVSYVVLSPTRELAQQTHKVFKQISETTDLKMACVIGGENIEKQIKAIDNGVDIVIGTPGRVNDLVKRKVLVLDKADGVVFDEADRLFDMGFQKDIESILGTCNDTRQLIMVSATSNQEVLRTAYKFKSEPVELRLNEDSLLVDHIDHKIAMLTAQEKFPYLVNLLRNKENAYSIIFCNTQFQTHLVAEWLIAMGFKAKPISGRLSQNKRTRLMEDFRSKKVTTLVCTDVAARGLDIKDVNFVINYDLPPEAANYVHRIGRTGRAGEAGEAISFCAHEDCEFLDPIYELIDSKIEKMDIDDSDFATDICKKPYIDKKTLKVVSKSKPENKDRNKTDKRNSNQDRKEKSVKPKVTPENKPFSKSPKVDKRFVEVTSYKLNEAKNKALEHFKINDESILDFDVLKEGKRRFFIFGAKETTYKFYLKPIYKRILLPYLINIIKAAHLDLFVKVSFRPGSLMISFSGKDEKMLLDNRAELLKGFEHIIKTYLYQKVVLHKDMKIQVKCFKNVKNEKSMSDEDVIALAKTLREKVLATNSSVKTKPMNAGHRRLVHLHFENDDLIKTDSIGSGRHKQVELSLR